MFTHQFNYRLITAILFFPLLVLLCSGCWDRRELDSISFVAGIGCDKGTEDDFVRVTAQIIDVSAVTAPDQGGGAMGNPFWNITSESQTVFAATRELSDTCPRRLFYSHNQLLVFSEELAKDGIRDYLDFFIRDVEPRTTEWMVVTPGKASELLSVKTRLQRVTALNLSQLIKDRDATSHTIGINLHQFAERTLSPTTAPIASWVDIVGDADSGKRLMVSGTAVFDKQLKLAGKLEAIETRGMMWILGEVEGGILVVESPGCIDGKKASLEILDASSKIEPRIENGKVKITVKIKESSSLGEDTCVEDPLNPEIWAELQKRNSQAIYAEAMLAVNKARKLNADVFGFGDAVYKKYPDEWKTLESQWKEIFPELEVDVAVESEVIRTGMILKPVG